MKKSKKSTVSLKAELDSVYALFQERVHRKGGMLDEELMSLTTRMDADPALYHPEQVTTDQVNNDVTALDDLLGESLIKEGKVAFLIMAGGEGSRFGGPKAFARIPGIDLSLLGWKLLQCGNMPAWVMTSPRMTQEVQRHISQLAVPMGMNGVIFEQFEGYRLTPDNRLSIVNGIPDLYPLGHGDVGPALVEAGVLADNPDIKHVVVCNVDNVMASPHPGVIGRHVRSGCKVTCEVVDRLKGDRGGVVANVNSKLQIAEDFRLPDGFADAALYHNTNTMVIDVDVFQWPISWRWHRVRKTVDTRIVIQYERLLQQYTEESPTNFLHVPRDARYLGVKTPEDMSHAAEILATYRFK